MIFQSIWANFLCAIAGGSLAIFFMIAGFRLLSGLFVLSISAELQEKNVAVGMAVMGMFIGIGLAVGLAIGLSLH